ncbi:hypothetical protein PAXRUDRAFT_130960 [Paxillus rubicundulus Ve08.2h10]|uniref:Ran-binding protein 10 n=1 Tax=Paxillus rubicundulus Ve08.2h10 TaxID=930991 RepID=A0A0D0ECT6_9AGAM|nr:hypothetical protein PAXRUDRAFT_130960 [Paxillus rubicundulus Ve08.2h10]
MTQDHRATGIPNGVRGSSTVASSPPTRHTARSFTHSSVLFNPGTAYPYTTYEPRVIRVDSARNTDVACPQSSSVSPTRARRPSATDVRALSAQRSSVAHIPAPTTEPAPFSRPSYLEHSALRHLLQTESPSLPPPRKAESTAVRADYTVGRRVQRSPSYDSDEDDMSPPREVRKSTPLPVTTSSPALLLPTRWSDEYRSPHLTVCSDGRELIYQGTTGGSDKDVAPARTAVPVPPACGIFYYEVEITSKASKNRVSVGFIGQDVKMSRLPGWEKNSWGYHGDNGTICSGDKNGTSFGSTFGVGDIIGCGVDFTQNKVFYTKNGALLGTVFDNVGKDCDIFPAVGLCHPNESIHANFGQDPFKYDIEDHVLQQRNQTWAKIQSTPLKWPADKFPERSTDALASPSSVTDESVKIPVNELVLSYLSHHGYARATRALEAQCRARGGLPARTPSAISAEDYVMVNVGHGLSTIPSKPTPIPPPVPADDIELRTRIVQSVIAGDVDTALSETRNHFPRVLEADAGLMLFKLRCRKFVELVLEAAELKKKRATGENEMGVGAYGPGWGLDSLDRVEVMGTLDGMGMDVDEEGAGLDMNTSTGTSMSSTPISVKLTPTPSVVSLASTASWASAAAAQYASALEKAVAYGQELESDYKNRPEVRAIFKRTSVIMAYDDPLGAGGDAAEVAGQAARVALATELNQAILQSQGRPAQPLLDRLYRQTAVCLTQLALMGNGAAAFADMPKEFLDV